MKRLIYIFILIAGCTTYKDLDYYVKENTKTKLQTIIWEVGKKPTQSIIDIDLNKIKKLNKIKDPFKDALLNKLREKKQPKYYILYIQKRKDVIKWQIFNAASLIDSLGFK